MDKWNMSSESETNFYELFQNLAPDHDRVNDLGTLGMHRIWRKKLIKALAPNHNTKIIDMAAGTGMTTLYLINYIKKAKIKNCHITVCDISENMLEIAEKKLGAVDYDQNLIDYVLGNADNTAFKENSFDIYNITFGVRCTHYDQMLKDAFRILKPGGKFFCMDFSHVGNPIIRWVFEFFVNTILPLVMFVCFGSAYPYKVLKTSRAKFPDQETWKNMIEDAGFRDVGYENLWFGLVAIHRGVKPK